MSGHKKIDPEGPNGVDFNSRTGGFPTMLFNKEPTVIIGGIAEIIRAINPMLLVFGVIQWTDAQTGAVILVVGVCVGFAEQLFARSQTVPAAVADKQIEIAKASDTNRPTEQIIAQAAKETK